MKSKYKYVIFINSQMAMLFHGENGYWMNRKAKIAPNFKISNNTYSQWKDMGKKNMLTVNRANFIKFVRSEYNTTY